MKKHLLFFLTVFVFVGCSIKEPTAIEPNDSIEPSYSEVLKYEQNAILLSDAPYVPQEEFNELLNDFVKKYFSPWDKQKMWGTENDVLWGFAAYKNNFKFAGENKKTPNELWFEDLEKNANIDNYGSVLAYAVTVKNANIRILPTDKPLYSSSNKSFDYPFDSLQASTISAMQPILISHYSKDRAWAYAQSAFVSGWIKSDEFAVIDNELKEKIKNAEKIAVIKDNVPLYYEKGAFANYLKIGTLLPLISENDENFEVFIVKKTEDGTGVEAKAVLKSQFVAYFPLRFSSANVKLLADELLKENYGWGGLFHNRDCSQLTRDFLGTFGIWLPRNSNAQKNHATYVDVSALSPNEKEDRLKELAEPYLTLVYLPGHIMLYVGNMNEKALILHNIWGIRTKDDGRYLIGHSVISDMYLGENVPSVNPQSLLINRMQGFTILASLYAQNRAKLFSAYNESIASIKDNVVYFKNGTTLTYDDKIEKDYDQKYENPDIEDQFYEHYNKSTLAGKPQNNAGRIRNESFFKALYGENELEVNKNLVNVVWLPSSLNRNISFNKNNGAAKALQLVSDELDKLDGEYMEFLKDMAGTYNYRNVANTDKLSMHAFGIAIDINVKKSNYWQWDKNNTDYKNSVPQKIVDIFEKHGFIWGGKWSNFDTMHFEYRPELL